MDTHHNPELHAYLVAREAHDNANPTIVQQAIAFARYPTDPVKQAEYIRLMNMRGD